MARTVRADGCSAFRVSPDGPVVSGDQTVRALMTSGFGVIVLKQAGMSVDEFRELL